MEAVLGLRDSITPIGSVLLRKGLISESALDRALLIQKLGGGRLGNILLGEGAIHPKPLAEAIADHHHMAFVDLTQDPVDASLLDAECTYDYLMYQVIPWKKKDDKVVLATTDVSFSVINFAREQYGANFELVITSPRDIAWSIQQYFGRTMDFDARSYLHKNYPQYSVLETLKNFKTEEMWLAAVLVFVLAITFTAEFAALLFIALNWIYFVTIILKAVLFEKGARTTPKVIDSPIPQDKDLPVYTVLIPLYKEAASIPHLITAMRAIDYPRAKLDIKLVLESDDEETFAAAKAASPETMFDIIRVPFSLPRTKPKACNYALKFARGEYVTIFDAEDRPDPQQLKKALQAFHSLPESVVCLQARLNYYNRDENLLTQFFAIEYSAWFDFMLKGLEHLDIPIPLGGTSNHISLARLKALGEWDPYNVTEDADLGLRIALMGNRTANLDSLTLEEAPTTISSWINQRSRWIKGYMQTWLVHMKNPGELVKNFGWRGLLGFHFFIGGPCIVFLSAPFLWAISLGWMLGLWHDTLAMLPGWVITLSLLNLGIGLVAHAWFSLRVIAKLQWPGMTFAVFAFPVYWILHSFASFKALWQLITRPYHWEKTSHGVSSKSTT
jgi:cellulose synthase/poly-beta-1,6-N-acetylglucosamine synthase-like glycosyltransferase